MPAYNPANQRIRLQFGAVNARDVPILDATPVVVHPIGAGEGPDGEVEQIENPGILFGGQRAKSLRGTLNPTWPLACVAEPDSYAILAASALRYTVITDLGDGAYKWEISPTLDSGDTSTRRLIADLYLDDDLVVRRFPGGVIGTITDTGEVNGVSTLEAQFVGTSSDLWGPVTQTVGTGAPMPYLRGIPRYEILNAGVDGDIDILVSAVPSATAGAAFDIKVKREGDVAYGATVFPIYTGRWNNLELSDPAVFDTVSFVGQRQNDVEVFWATAVDIAATDAFRVPIVWAEGDVWAGVIPALQGFGSNATQIYLDGVRLGAVGDARATQYECTFGYEAEPSPGLGSPFPQVKHKGQVMCDITFEREYLTADLQRKLKAGKSCSLEIRRTSELTIADSLIHWEIRIICPDCTPTGVDAVPSSPTDWVEPVTLMANPPAEPDAEGYGAIVTVVINCSLASFA